MSILSWIFGDRAASGTPVGHDQTTTAAAVVIVPRALGMKCDGSFPLACVGESHYQAAFATVCGAPTEDGVDARTQVRLVPENTNPYDPQAVRIDAAGNTLAYLSRHDAQAYRKLLAAAGHSDAVVECNARIRGGWNCGPDDQGEFGIYLDLPLYGPARAKA